MKVIRIQKNKDVYIKEEHTMLVRNVGMAFPDELAPHSVPGNPDSSLELGRRDLVVREHVQDLFAGFLSQQPLQGA
jgi:hypothetical protein